MFIFEGGFASPWEISAKRRANSDSEMPLQCYIIDKCYSKAIFGTQKTLDTKKKKGQVTPVPSQIWEESRCLFSSYGVISDKVTN